MKPNSILVVIWWLWFVPALMVLPLPLQWYFALLMRGLESVSSSGIGGGGFAILTTTAVPFIFGFLPLLFLSLLYGFLYWRHRERGVALNARFRVPLYGAGLIALMLAVMALVAFSPARREYGMSPPSGFHDDSMNTLRADLSAMPLNVRRCFAGPRFGAVGVVA